MYYLIEILLSYTNKRIIYFASNEKYTKISNNKIIKWIMYIKIRKKLQILILYKYIY